MTKEEFITNYCKRSDITETYFHKHFVALPCDPEQCDYKNCKGWVTESKDDTGES